MFELAKTLMHQKFLSTINTKVTIVLIYDIGIIVSTEPFTICHIASFYTISLQGSFILYMCVWMHTQTHSRFFGFLELIVFYDIQYGFSLPSDLQIGSCKVDVMPRTLTSCKMHTYIFKYDERQRL